MNDFETARRLFVEGLQSLAANDLVAAEMRFAGSLELLPDRLSTLNNLSAIKLKLGKFPDAEDLARKAAALESNSPQAWSNLALALAAMGRHEEALLACKRAVSCDSSHAMSRVAEAMILRELKRLDEALLACEAALLIDPAKYESLYHKSLVLKELNRDEEARDTYRQALAKRVASSPVFIGERCASQKAEGLIINHQPQTESSFRSFEDMSRFCANFPGQLADHLQEDFHFNYVFINSAGAPLTRNQIPQPDFIINNHVNGDVLLAEGNLEAVARFVESFAVPIVNHPAKALPTVRDLSAQLLAGIVGVRTPRTARFSRLGKTSEALAREIEGQLNYPLITRRLAAQEGKGMNKIDTRQELIEMLSRADCPDSFFVTEFIDSRGQNQFYRKLRAAIVQNEIIIVRVDYDTFWRIYARKSDDRVAFYLSNRHLLEEEQRICTDPERELGQRVTHSLRAIRERIPLDVFGIDFDVDADGKVVFYEANATMNLFSTARKEVPYPKEPEECLKQAFRRYFVSLANRR